MAPGFSPEEMEKLVTKKIEDELEGLSEIRRHESKSFEGTSKINVHFHADLSEEEIDQGMQEVRNAVDRVDDLPEEAKVPHVLEDVAERMEEIKGLSEVDILGERENEIWVELNPLRMSSYGISTPEVIQAVGSRMHNLPGGTLEMGYHETAIRMVGEPESPMDVGNLALRSKDGGIVYLRDIARITPTLEKPSTLTFVDKKNALVLAPRRKRNVNMIQIVDDIKALIKTVEAEYPGLRSTIYFEQPKVIKQRIKELQTNASLGIMAVFVILWISMGIRNAIYASIGIPVSFLLTFTLMKAFGLSVDGVTLFGLILVLGIIVDDAIVVIENIFRYIEEGVSPVEATLKGSREVLTPVLASVSTNMAAFFPLLFMISGIIGRYLSILPKVVLFALCASLFEVFYMLPSHVVELTPVKATVKTRSRRKIDVFAPLRRIDRPLHDPGLHSLLSDRF
jgi:multidrug efflux pump subunit AcrB